MANVNLEYGEVATIPWTIDTNITGKRVIFAAGDTFTSAPKFRKATDGVGGVTVTQASPTGVGTIAAAEADFGSGKLEFGRSYHASLWYEDAGGANPVCVWTGTVVVTPTRTRAA